MSWMILFFFFSYGGMHYYFFSRFKAAFQLPALYAAALVLLLTIMVASPFLVYLAERYLGHLAARIFAFFSYSWMGFVFLFLCLSLLLDLCRLLLNIAGHFPKAGLWPLILKPKLSFLLSFCLALMVFAYGLFEAGNIRTERIIVKTGKLPASVARIRIVQITDVHIGLIVQGRRLERIVAKIKEAAPDILVSTGDLVDGQADAIAEQFSLFQSITPPLGKFAVTGNHEYYAGLGNALDLTRRGGFNILRGEGKVVNGLINIAGLDDLVVRKGLGEPVKNVFFRKTLAALPSDKFTLLLYHRPVIEPDYLGFFDLQLSGHTHKGQIFPFSFITGLVFPRQAGYYALPQHSALYASRGTGTWGPPVRFLAPPEITIIDLVPENKAL